MHRPARRHLLLAIVFVAFLAGGLITTARQRTAAALERGDLTSAAAIQNRLAWVRLDDADHRFALARALVAADRLDDAATQYQRGLARDSRGEQWAALARVEVSRGNLEAAIDDLERGFEENQDPLYLKRASKYLLQIGQPERAFELFERAVLLEPASARSHVWIAARAKTLGLPEQQIRHLRAALALEPAQPTLRRSLAWLLAACEDPRLRDGAEAVRLAEALADETGRRDATVLDLLAASLAADGRFDDAVLVATEARDRASHHGQSELAASIGERLALYRSGRAFVESVSSAARG